MILDMKLNHNSPFIKLSRKSTQSEKYYPPTTCTLYLHTAHITMLNLSPMAIESIPNIDTAPLGEAVWPSG